MPLLAKGSVFFLAAHPVVIEAYTSELRMASAIGRFLPVSPCLDGQGLKASPVG